MHIMANVKNRHKSSKSKKNNDCVQGKIKKLSTGNKQKMVESKKTVLKDELTAEEKVAIFLQNGHLLKNKFEKKPPVSDGNVDKNALNITKDKLVSKNGLIKNKTKESLGLLDEILKNELMIMDSHKSSKSKSKHSNMPFLPGINNNCEGISDQNKEKSSHSKEKKSDKTKNEPKHKKSFEKIKNKSKSKKVQKQDDVSKRSPKMKQVTLSNGITLRLTLLECDYCHKTFANKSSLRRHIYIHLNIKPYGCSQCSKRYRQKFNLKTHFEKCHPEMKSDIYVCKQCNKPFLLKENLELHLATHVKLESSYRCVFCDQIFSHHLLLIEHEKHHLVSGRFQCSICKMSYDCRSRLSLHVKSHLNIKEYICQYCGKEFLRPNSLRRHVEVCHIGFRIQCPVCDKKLKGHLNEHMRTHEKEKPHACPDCGQRFTQSTQLNVHRRNHSGARPYPCLICDRRFSHSNALMLHIRRHTGEKPFPCAMCHISFSQLPHMKAHMARIHGKSEAYKCPKCPEFFKLRIELESHKETCTVGDRELSFEEKTQASLQLPEVQPAMSLSKMRFLLALLLTMIASKEKLKFLGFNKRLIDEILIESLEAMGHEPCKDDTLEPLPRLKMNIDILLKGTIPADQMLKFKKENKSTEELLVLLTDDKKKMKNH